MSGPADEPYELLDIVDENDVVTRTMRKREAHMMGARHRHSWMMLTTRIGREQHLLLGKRSEGKSDNAGLWDRLGCHVRSGEMLQSEKSWKKSLEDYRVENQMTKSYMKFLIR